jgi:hypothetical protein
MLFSLPVGTEMFHFPTFPPHTLYIQMRVTRHHSCRVSPFGHPRISARLTAPRGLSQPPTSFIGSWCQGIHRTLLHTYKQRCSRPLCSSQTTHPLEFEPRTSTPKRRPVSTRNPNGSLSSWKERLFFQDPTVCRLQSSTPSHSGLAVSPAHVSVPPVSTTGLHMSPKWLWHSHHPTVRAGAVQMLLRKEVIQPHLPVRLPCYDFVPIANPTFDGSLHKG